MEKPASGFFYCFIVFGKIFKIAESSFDELKEKNMVSKHFGDDDFREAFMNIISLMTTIMLERYELWNIECGEVKHGI